MCRRAVAAWLLTAVLASGCTTGSVPSANFGFDRVTYELSHAETERLGGALSDSDAAVIRSTALAELRSAYSGVSLTFTEGAQAPYRVVVFQEIGGQMTRSSAVSAHAGESRSLGPFGGRGAVSFSVLASGAIHYAPPGATRAEIVAAIGRGIGRAAAHEFAHQILPEVDLHEGTDKESYEYGNADRAAQYYGVLHWTKARPIMSRKLGGRWWNPPF